MGRLISEWKTQVLVQVFVSRDFRLPKIGPVTKDSVICNIPILKGSVIVDATKQHMGEKAGDRAEMTITLQRIRSPFKFL